MLESNGVKRTIAVAVLLLGQAFSFFPILAPYKPILDTLGAVFGVTGLAHAAVSGTLLGGTAKL